MTPSRLTRALWAAAALCLLAALVALGVWRADDDGPAVATSGGVTATSASGAPATTAAGDGSAGPVATATPPVSTAPAAHGTSTSAAPSHALGTPSDPGPTNPPAPGTYRYRSSTDGGEASDSWRTYERRGTSGGETRVDVTTRSERGELRNELAFRPDGIYLLKTSGAAGAQAGSCTWQPALLVTRLPLAKGTAWQGEASCQPVAGYTARTTVTGKVVDLVRTNVGGEVLDVWVVDSMLQTEFVGPQGSTRFDIAAVVWFSPKYGLTTKERTTRDGVTTEEVLVSTRP